MKKILIAFIALFAILSVNYALASDTTDATKNGAASTRVNKQYQFSGTITHWENDSEGKITFAVPHVGENGLGLQIRGYPKYYIDVSNSHESFTITVNKREWIANGRPKTLPIYLFNGYVYWGAVNLRVTAN